MRRRTWRAVLSAPCGDSDEALRAVQAPSRTPLPAGRRRTPGRAPPAPGRRSSATRPYSVRVEGGLGAARCRCAARPRRGASPPRVTGLSASSNATTLQPALGGDRRRAAPGRPAARSRHRPRRPGRAWGASRRARQTRHSAIRLPSMCALSLRRPPPASSAASSPGVPLSRNATFASDAPGSIAASMSPSSTRQVPASATVSW